MLKTIEPKTKPSPSRKRNPPRQSRSIATRDSLLDAAERLLKNRPWDKISTVAIMLEAGCSNGAIYGRFKNKDDILVALYERHNERLRERFTNQQGKNQTRKETLENFFDREIDQLIKMHRENRWLLAAVGTLSRRKPDVVTPEMRTQRKRMFEMIGSQFLRFEDEFETPHLEREIQLIIFFVSTIIREAILHQGPHFGTLKLKDKELKKSLKKMAFGFLGVKD